MLVRSAPAGCGWWCDGGLVRAQSADGECSTWCSCAGSPCIARRRQSRLSSKTWGAPLPQSSCSLAGEAAWDWVRHFCTKRCVALPPSMLLLADRFPQGRQPSTPRALPHPSATWCTCCMVRVLSAEACAGLSVAAAWGCRGESWGVVVGVGVGGSVWVGREAKRILQLLQLLLSRPLPRSPYACLQGACKGRENGVGASSDKGAGSDKGSDGCGRWIAVG